jgi:hypothetical protein
MIEQFEYGYIFGAVCPTKDKALGLMLPVANTAGMIEHLRLISQATGLVPFSAHILVIEPCCPILVSS